MNINIYIFEFQTLILKYLGYIQIGRLVTYMKNKKNGKSLFERNFFDNFFNVIGQIIFINIFYPKEMLFSA